MGNWYREQGLQLYAHLSQQPVFEEDHGNCSCLVLVSEKNYCMFEQWINLLNKIGKRHFRIVSVIYLLIARAILIWTLGACR